MSVDDGVRTLEIELASLAQDLTAPGPHECVLCYVNRMLVQFGCDTSLRWTRRWRALRAPRATQLERRIGREGAFCDCELFTNGWDVTVAVEHDPMTGEDRWPDDVQGCRGVRNGTTQPCTLWARRAPQRWPVRRRSDWD
ncbi:DUF2695 domain-containing protein [Georgenia daeguensis]|uniref:DUF2695 domain-containing protein n=1 Tax=Georgenia daeguensis TaxID=908355 RepID=A0ABP8ERQ2_9MICO